MSNREFRWKKYKIMGLKEMTHNGPSLASGFNRLRNSDFINSNRRPEELFACAGLDPNLPRFVSILKKEWRGHPKGKLVLQTIKVSKDDSAGSEKYEYELAIEL